MISIAFRTWSVIAATVVALFCFSASSLAQQINPIDPAFKISSALTGVPTKIAVDKQDRVVAVGDFLVLINGHSQRGIARFLSDGSLDTSFDCGSGFDAGITPTGLLIQPDNKVVVLGSFSSFNGSAASGWIRLTSAGPVDATFVQAVAAPYAATVDSRGRFYVASGTTLARLAPTGSSDPTFQAFTIDGTVSSLVSDGDDKPLFIVEKHVSAPLGIKNYITSDAWLTLWRLTETGTTDYTRELWSQHSMVSYINYAWSAQVAPLSNGAYYIAFYVGSPSDPLGYYYPVQKFNRDGSLDDSFVTNLYGRMLPSGSSGAFYLLNAFPVASSATRVLPLNRNEPIRLSADGRIDITFNSNGTSLVPIYSYMPDAIQDAAVTSHGALLLAFTGSVPTDSGQTRTLVARYRVQNYTPFAPSFDPATVPGVLNAVTGESFSATVTANGTPPLSYQWIRDGVVVSTNAILTIANPSDSDAGTYTVKATSSYGSATSSPIEIRVQPKRPVIIVQPVPLGLSAGAVGSLSASATGSSPMTYQWFKDGQAIAGATNATLTLTGASSIEGDYVMVAANSHGTATTDTVHVTFVTTRLVNISTRSWVGPGDSVQIAGFVVQGSVPKTVLIRAAGPALIPLNVTGTLPNPTLKLHDARKSNAVIATNDDWSSDSAAAAQIEAAAARTGAFAWTRGSKDAAILKTLDPGIYTALVADAGNGSGTALIEVYDADTTAAGSLVVNISTRAQARTGDDALIVGFVISGSEKKSVLIRGAGPALTVNLDGVLADPTIELHDALHGNVVIATNDDWSSDSAAASKVAAAAAKTGAFSWASGSKDAALLLSLDPGIYTVILRGKGTATGNALIEVYDVP